MAENLGRTPVDTAGSIRIDPEALIFKRFAEKSNVASHERTHTGEKPYACFYCGKTFAHSGAARKHERTQHRGTV